jgi:hypothetical protein
MPELRGRPLIEARFGPLGCGAEQVSIRGTDYDIPTLLAHMGLNFEDAKPIDVQAIGPGRFVLRYYDGQDQRVVAHEFDDQFQFIAETRAHIAEWIGDEAYFSLFSGH